MGIKNFYKKFRKERIKLNLSQQVVADKLGITRQALSQFENGCCSLSKATIKKLCELLKINFADLFFKNPIKSIIVTTFILFFATLIIQLAIFFHAFLF